ncbi:glutathione S-transferase [Rhizobium sp. C1]|uniref:glutathione S-transferase n=1 Tax=Rhizobium sp. C1 TaxID=1349799 RepID=UPI001E62D65C|nr:glutathione S-transferase [Rhizobium sp. C1]MCD2177687.1 glutathione S-transferase [Rhizobium sp. C1]
MKVLYSPASPYSAKVRMAARLSGLPVESELVKTDEEPARLVDNNPLGKIPVLLREDGSAIFDSRAIMHFLDRESGGKLYPADPAARTEAEVLEALADGITDSLIAHVYERRYRTEEKIHQPWLDRQWSKVVRGLAFLEANPVSLGNGLTGGHIALAALAGYLGLRFAGQWETLWPGHRAFIAEFEARFPAFAEFKPQ